MFNGLIIQWFNCLMVQLPARRNVVQGGLRQFEKRKAVFAIRPTK